MTNEKKGLQPRTLTHEFDEISSSISSIQESVDIPRIQLILAEKRTSLAVMRTGIAVFTLPLSVITVLIATSRYYSFLENYYFLIPLLILCLGLVVLGVYLVHRSIMRLWKLDALIEKIKREDATLSVFLGNGV
ncbi:MAG: hypothetical protein AB1656_09395 [Candidatus Omnitrophota bacterium]